MIKRPQPHHNFSPFENERDHLGRLISMKPENSQNPFLSTKNREIYKLIKTKNEVSKKRQTISNNDFDYFHSSNLSQTKNTKNRRNVNNKTKNAESSDYFAFSLKKILDYDEDKWKKTQILKPLNTTPQNSINFKNLTKKTPEQITSHPFKKINMKKSQSQVKKFFTKKTFFYDKKIKKPKFFNEKCPPLGSYDVDKCKFMMSRSPLWLINQSKCSSHDYYFKNIINEKDFLQRVETQSLTDRNTKNPIEIPEKEINFIHFKKDFKNMKDYELAKEIKKQEDLSIKVLGNYDKNFWDKFVMKLKTTKDHIKKLRIVSSNLSYADPGKFLQMLKNNPIIN